MALVDLVPERAEQVAAMVNGLGTRGIAVVGDVLDDARSPASSPKPTEKLGGLDSMISIVGAAALGSLLDTTAAIWDQQMALNLRYFFLVAKKPPPP